MMSAEAAHRNYKAYCTQLTQTLAPMFNDFVYSMYLNAFDYCQQCKLDNSQVLHVFQQILAKADKFSDESMQPLFEQVGESVPWLRQVLRQMIVQHVYLLMSTRGDKSTGTVNFDFKLPSNEHMLRELNCVVCRHMRAHVGLYQHDVPEVQREQNTVRAENEISKILAKQGFMRLVPINEIVQRHLVAEQQQQLQHPESVDEKKLMAELLESEMPADVTAEKQNEVPVTVDYVESSKLKGADEEKRRFTLKRK
jgi:hypothetical protein